MLKIILDFDESKNPWILLFIASSILLSSSLFFQHIMGLEPCTLCIYQRISVMGIFIASLIQINSAKKNSTLKIIPYTLFIISSFFGLKYASYQWYEAYMTKNNDFYFSNCGQGLEVYFPFIEDYEILRDIFIARGICTEIDWSLFGLEMYHYTTIVFLSLFLISIFFFSVNLIKIKKGM